MHRVILENELEILIYMETSPKLIKTFIKEK